MKKIYTSLSALHFFSLIFIINTNLVSKDVKPAADAKNATEKKAVSKEKPQLSEGAENKNKAEKSKSKEDTNDKKEKVEKDTVDQEKQKKEEAPTKEKSAQENKKEKTEKAKPTESASVDHKTTHEVIDNFKTEIDALITRYKAKIMQETQDATENKTLTADTGVSETLIRENNRLFKQELNKIINKYDDIVDSHVEKAKARFAGRKG